jgi:2-oxoglutarate dehydrogenase E1 component
MHVVKSLVKEPNKELFVDWRPYLGHAWTARHDTSFDLKTLQELSAKLMEVPEGFVVQRQVQKIYEDRQKMQVGGLPINWGYAETMARDPRVRRSPDPHDWSGDGRGTFSHRLCCATRKTRAPTSGQTQNNGQPFRPGDCSFPKKQCGRIRLLDHHAKRAGRSGKPSSVTSPTVPRS